MSERVAGSMRMDGAAQVIVSLGDYEGSADAFFAALIRAQAGLPGIACGAIVRCNSASEVDVLAVDPPLVAGGAPPWLVRAVELAPECVESGERIEVEDVGRMGRVVVLLPLPRESGFGGAGVYVIESDEGEARNTAMERLAMTLALIPPVMRRLHRASGAGTSPVIVESVRVLAAVNQQLKARGAAMTLCDHIAAAWGCERVSLGVMRDRSVHLLAMSHTEHVVRKTRLVSDIEAAMEECADQDTEILHPPASGRAVVSRQTRELADRHGSACVLSLPLRRGGEVCAAITLERSEGVFTEEGIIALRLLCELVSPRLLELEERDRWVGARAGLWARRMGALVVGPTHTWAKLLAVAIAVFIGFAAFVPGTARSGGSFRMVADQRRVVAAPFDAYIASSEVRIGDAVEGGRTILATLDTSEILLELAEARARRSAYLTEAATRRTEGKIAEAQIAEASVREAEATIALLENRIARAVLYAPIDGVVLAGELRDRVGGAIRTGELLFEVAPKGSLRVEIAVPEEQVAPVEPGQHGTIAAVAYPADRIPIIVERVEPAARMHDGRNVVVVHARLEESRAWLAAGLEGAARIETGRKPYGAIWFRHVADWLRLKLWLD